MYLLLSVVIAVTVAMLCFATAVVRAKRESAFFRGGAFLRWSALLAVFSLGTYWISALNNILPGVAEIMWGNALIAYGMLAGWLLGGVVGYLLALRWHGRDKSA